MSSINRSLTISDGTLPDVASYEAQKDGSSLSMPQESSDLDTLAIKNVGTSDYAVVQAKNEGAHLPEERPLLVEDRIKPEAPPVQEVALLSADVFEAHLDRKSVV